MSSRLFLTVVWIFVSGWIYGQTNVKVFGELRRIMQQGDFAAVVSLDTLSLNPKLFGLGVASGLKGEIIMLNGVVYQSHVDEGKIVTSEGNNSKPAMIVIADVPEFAQAFEFRSLISIAELQNQMKTKLEEKGISGAVPFLIRTSSAKVSYHVIDWKDGEFHTPQNHKQFAQSGTFENEELIILGFYSEHHQGIFTPHSSSVHMHVFNRARQIVGHVDSVSFDKDVKVLIP